MHAGCFSVFIFHRALSWTTGSLTCPQILNHAIAHEGVRTYVRENPLPHRGIEPATAACRSDVLPTEQHLHPSYTSVSDRRWFCGQNRKLFLSVCVCVWLFDKFLVHGVQTVCTCGTYGHDQEHKSFKQLQRIFESLCFRSSFIRIMHGKDKQDRGRGEKTTSGNGQAWSLPSPRGQWRTGKKEESGSEIICGAPTSLTFKGQMVMMMNAWKTKTSWNSFNSLGCIPCGPTWSFWHSQSRTNVARPSGNCHTCVWWKQRHDFGVFDSEHTC